MEDIIYIYIYTDLVQGGAPKKDSQVGEHNPDFTMVFGMQQTILIGVDKPTHNL